MTGELFCGRPMAARISLSLATNWGLVIALCLKNGPGWFPEDCIYCRMAETGQRWLPVCPTTVSDPVPNWSPWRS